MPEEKWKDVDKFEPKYNIQPGSRALVVVKTDEVRCIIEYKGLAPRLDEHCGLTDVPPCTRIQGKKTIQAMQWGLVPSWTKEGETKPDFFRLAA